jgi:hypothetical protein
MLTIELLENAIFDCGVGSVLVHLNQIFRRRVSNSCKSVDFVGVLVLIGEIFFVEDLHLTAFI